MIQGKQQKAKQQERLRNMQQFLGLMRYHYARQSVKEEACGGQLYPTTKWRSTKETTIGIISIKVSIKRQTTKATAAQLLKIQNAEIVGQKLTPYNKTNIHVIISHSALILQDDINWRVWFRNSCMVGKELGGLNKYYSICTSCKS